MGWGKVRRKVRKAVKQTRQNVHRGWDTTRGIADDVVTYGKQFGEDAGKTVRDQSENMFKPENLEQLFNDPLAYGRKNLEPVFGNGQEAGLWDKYGQWTMLIPGVGPVVYGTGQSINIANDYNRTGNEDLARDQARQMAATYAANAVFQPVADTTAGIVGGPGYISQAAGGAAAGATAGLGYDNAEEGDIARAAAVGAAASTVGHALGGQTSEPYTTTDSVTGETINLRQFNEASPGSLNLGAQAGQFGSMAVKQWDTADRQNEARRKYERWLAEYQADLSRRLSAYDQGKINRQNISAPELESKLAGTYEGELLAGDSLSNPTAQKKQRNYGSQFGMSNPQVTTGTLSDIYRG